MDKQSLLRQLPAVHKLLAADESLRVLTDWPHSLKTAAIAAALAELRTQAAADAMNLDGWQTQTETSAILWRAHRLLQHQVSPHLRRVLNLTGVIIHTNLGRAPLSARALQAVDAVARGYSNLEYVLDTGTRGSRHAHVEERICRLTGAEAALVVNNNAAAALLALRVMGDGGEALVSRGQLIEIGGSFRVSEIMRESGVGWLEVGTTNKTRLADYQAAWSERTRLVLRVHTSNFRIVGFTEQPSLHDLVTWSHSVDVPVYEDLGSGALFDLASRGIGDEPTIGASLSAGVDVVSFSGDKLLGAGQAGILAGKRVWIERMKKHQLARALRVDKMTLAALEATLIDYEDEAWASSIPVIRMLTESAAAVCARAETVAAALLDDPHIAEALDLTVGTDVSRIGGGALPTEEIATWVVRIRLRRGAVDSLAAALRRLPEWPVVGRIADDWLVLDVRTLLPDESAQLVASIRAAVAAADQSPREG